MFSAQLDTCVLVPSLTRDVLLEVAERDVYRPLWSTEILAELERALTRLMQGRGADDETIRTYIGRLQAQMTAAFPDALVEGWERLVPTIELPDPDDRHVVAAAVVGRADVIVTNNRDDFPIAALPKPLFTQTADAFLLASLDLYPAEVMAAVDQVAARTGRYGPVRSSIDIAEALRTRTCPQFAEHLLAELRARDESR